MIYTINVRSDPDILAVSHLVLASTIGLRLPTPLLHIRKIFVSTIQTHIQIPD
jgi:hypothetical protein